MESTSDNPYAAYDLSSEEAAYLTDSSSGNPLSTDSAASDSGSGSSDAGGDSSSFNPASGNDASTDADMTGSQLLRNEIITQAKPVRLNTTKLAQQGLMAPISQGGILPLFGFVSAAQLSECYQVEPKGVFLPNFKNRFLSPANTTLDPRATTFTVQIKAASTIAVALYPKMGRLQNMGDLGNFYLVRAPHARRENCCLHACMR